MIFEQEAKEAYKKQLEYELRDWVFDLYTIMQRACKDGTQFSEEELMQFARREVELNTPRSVWTLLRDAYVRNKRRDNDPDYPIILLNKPEELMNHMVGYSITTGGLILENMSIHT